MVALAAVERIGLVLGSLRETGYAMKQTKQDHSMFAAPANSVMMVTGIAILLFTILHLADFRLVPPAFDKRLLQGVAGVFQVADQIIKRTQQLRLMLVEGRFKQSSPARTGLGSRLVRCGLAGVLGHTHAF